MIFYFNLKTKGLTAGIIWGLLAPTLKDAPHLPLRFFGILSHVAELFNEMIPFLPPAMIPTITGAAIGYKAAQLVKKGLKGPRHIKTPTTIRGN